MINLLRKKFTKKTEERDPYGSLDNSNSSDFNITLVIGVIIAFFIFVAFLYFKLHIFSKKQTSKSVSNLEEITEENASSSHASLPESEKQYEFDKYDLGTSTEGIKAEDLSFGMFYKKPKDNFKPKLETYNLPLDTKTDVENYFKVNRTFNISKYLGDLNNYGFSVFNGTEIGAPQDFYKIFRFLAEKKVPIVLSSDFVLYYYQTMLKEAYEDIEKNIFYENLWDMSKILYDISFVRYKKELEKLGEVNDPLLEGKRLSLAFWTLNLKLLEPTKDQISKQTNLEEGSRFSEEELNYFHINTPLFLEKEINEEMELIRKGREEKRSPILGFKRNYRDFQVPSTYLQSPKLVNFYLATRWLNTLFPLYEQSNECPNCLLDKDDHLINLIANTFIVDDISKSQNVKNYWASIYKFISFFRGLSQGYTFLNYEDALKEAFGENYDLEKIFSKDNKNRSKDIQKIKDILNKVQFLEINGAESYVKDDITKIGMKILQDDYWPNDFIFGNFVGDDMQFLKEENKEVPVNLFTICGSKKVLNFHRCRAFGLDIINLIYPIKDGDGYFNLNTNYSGYQEKVNNFTNILNKFDKYTWNNNIYWMTLDYLKPGLKAKDNSYPRYMQSDEWQNKKVYKTALGSFINMQLEEDILESYYNKTKGSNIALMPSCNSLNYVEPDVDLYQELIARNDMLIRMMYALEINRKTNSAIGALKDLNIELQKILDISKKELEGGFISSDDCDFINDLIGRNFVAKKSKKSLNIITGERKIKESIDGMNILALIYMREGERYLAFGPVFNYHESRK